MTSCRLRSAPHILELAVTLISINTGDSVKRLPGITDRPVRLGILISGGGRTMLNFVDRIQDGSLNAEIPLVIASHNDCPGIDRAHDAGLTCASLARSTFRSVEAFSEAIFSRMRECRVDLVLLAGFLSLVRIPEDFEYRVLNIHPSLIPAFCGRGYYGSHVHESALARGVRVSGCTVHFADNQYDHGPIIVQRAVVIPDGTTPASLADLVFEQERIAYPEAVLRVISGHLGIDGQRTAMLDVS